MVWYSMDDMSVKHARTIVRSIRLQKSGLLQVRAGQKHKREFIEIVCTYYKDYGRHTLPWRKTKSPYRTLVSEVMLQQTQVDRVIPKYKEFIRAFPSVHALASASLGEVLRVWQGLGYNRRAKMLHSAAKKVVNIHDGKIPREYELLKELPGVGEYTAKAIRVFSWNEPEVMIETNIRSVYIHHFFKKRKMVTEKKLASYISKTLDTKNPREWYSALMDYGSYLKMTYPNPSRKSVLHKTQTRFKGSNREIRGAIIRALVAKKHTSVDLFKLPFKKKRIQAELIKLLEEEMIVRNKKMFSVPETT
ncbi:A/G-specific adenine glycosylase [Patescibacteria group bacterium]|nr:MAG: A/G-specific adenine glycosylase [Patescibacteria group bacterium]